MKYDDLTIRGRKKYVENATNCDLCGEPFNTPVRLYLSTPLTYRFKLIKESPFSDLPYLNEYTDLGFLPFRLEVTVPNTELVENKVTKLKYSDEMRPMYVNKSLVGTLKYIEKRLRGREIYLMKRRKNKFEDYLTKTFGLSYVMWLDRTLHKETFFFKRFRIYKPLIEHNHKTGKIRGIVCQECNSTIATIENNSSSLALPKEYFDFLSLRPHLPILMYLGKYGLDVYFIRD